MKKEKLKVYILIGIAFLLGLAILNQSRFNRDQQKTNPPAGGLSSPSAVQSKLLSENLTEDERFILYPPSSDASKSALKKHAQIVAKLAKDGDTIDLKNCQPTTLVLKVKQGSELTIKNQDNIKYKIMFDEEHAYELPANGSQTIKAQFKYGTGDYGYVCKGAVRLAGFLHIIP